MDEIFYFAYGMLTDPYIMPEDAEFYGKALLNNHSLEFRYYANAVESSESMYGVLWSIDNDILAELDMVEGVPTLYTRKQVQVTSKEIGTVTAWVYNMTEDTRTRLADKKPAVSYLKSLAYGYRTAKIPLTEIQKGMNR
jgi:gamma-glutamylcyclotransferase (GGCT)/AIG2-like uncharacterized protein YtfP